MEASDGEYFTFFLLVLFHEYLKALLQTIASTTLEAHLQGNTLVFINVPMRSSLKKASKF